LEAYTRRENIKIFNIEENEVENSNTESSVHNLLREKMKIPKENEDMHSLRAYPPHNTTKVVIKTQTNYWEI